MGQSILLKRSCLVLYWAANTFLLHGGEGILNYGKLGIFYWNYDLASTIIQVQDVIFMMKKIPLTVP
ncbi:hypothetical protein HNY73_005864 [Argiope bruennichi]|uniref:Uncharacterized protein n=1 Tax=Argiope bruennichi TaxID=94029 RepID=A0A8T0FND0_ARGBR|nr:hypothetical protein HNY73_005864 [Argiope bruennichi]